MAQKFWGIIYKITNTTDHSYYIGMRRSKKAWNKGYKGSGHRWTNHRKAHPNHTYKREILYNKAKNEEELCAKELEYIQKYINDSKCYNIANRLQGAYTPNQDKCPICGYPIQSARHAPNCSKNKKKENQWKK